jgi:hypothetical protein
MYHLQTVNLIGFSLSVDASQHDAVVIVGKGAIFRNNQPNKVSVNVCFRPEMAKLGSRLVAEAVYFNQITDLH